MSDPILLSTIFCAMWSYYKDRNLLITGGSGFLGTALIYRLVTQREHGTGRIYVLCRGSKRSVASSTHHSRYIAKADEQYSKLERKWAARLNKEDVSRMLDNITILEGDITKDRLGISKDRWASICNDINIVIHAASSINLAQSFEELKDPIVTSSERVAELTLQQCKDLECFVYVSTAFCNSHIRESIPVKEKLYPTLDDAIPGPEHFPWGYAYAKFITEGKLTDMFEHHDKRHDKRLLIVRPSIIGPAQQFPYPGFCVPLSTPRATISAALALTFSRRVHLPTELCDPEQEAVLDEVPVDVVVDRLFFHLERGADGIIHAVSGPQRVPFKTWWKQASSFRHIPWGVRPVWVPWNNERIHPIGRVFKIIGTNLEFDEKRTRELVEPGLASDLQLTINNQYSANNPISAHHVAECARYLTRKDKWKRALSHIAYPPLIHGKTD